MKFADMPYERVIYEDFERKFRDVMRAFREAGSGEGQFEAHKRYYELTSWAETNMTIAQIRHDADTADEFYGKEQDYYDETSPKIESLVAEYKKLLCESPYRDDLVGKIGPVAFRNMELDQKSVSDRIVPLMQEENALTTRYDKLIAGARIDWEGETLNLSLLQKHMRSADRGVRRRAWEKYAAFFAGHAEELDDIYDRLVRCRTAQAKELGFENYLGLGYCRMCRNSYGREEIESFRGQVKSVLVPFAQKLEERRRARLGLSRLSYIDDKVFFPEGNPAPIGGPEEILRAGKEMYGELSKETREFFDFMTEGQLFDVLGRERKKAGGYMTYLPLYHAPFIFANFNGTSSDVEVITHECGHAFQGYLSGQDEILEHRDITMETAETHSMSMEFFTERYMEKFFGKRADDYRAMHLESSVEFIPYGCAVDEFQHIVYENPGLSPAQRNEAWRELEREYLPHIDYEGVPYYEKGRFWQKQLHIYDYPLYYIDYCLAQSCALQYKAWMDEDFDGAWESYLRLCRLSASDFFPSMIREVGLLCPYDDGCLQKIVGKVEKMAR